ncbi:hypothetical protein [Microbacterium karelineae]|uniref:hypothetical protein n=1 Tax=Microbacterium karelineae TaxID=2654283 RepID=UPI001E61CE50|nr:hypothetical protein [Microbacterium karelineae]
MIVVSTHGLPTAADTAELIRGYVSAGDQNAATETLLQFTHNLRVSDPLTVAALTIDEPSDAGAGWAWSIAGIVELECERVGVPIPEWVAETVGDPEARWTPWAPELNELVDVTRVPDALRRRGVLIEAGELESA